MGILLRICCLLGVGAQLASSRVVQDSSALVQREVSLRQHSAGNLGPNLRKLRMSPQMMRSLLGSALAQLKTQLTDHEAELTKERDSAMRVAKYVNKVRSTLGRRGTLFGELAGLIPKGPYDEADQQVAMAILGLLRDKKFATSLFAGLRATSDILGQYRTRTEKRVAELVVKSANATDQKLPLLLKDFFGNQHHMLGGIVKAADTGLRSSISALPSNYSFVTSTANSLMDQLMQFTHGLMENNTKAIVDSGGSKFCGGLDITLAEDYLPLANQSVTAFRGVEAFAKQHMPEVQPEVVKLMKAVNTFTKILTQMHEDAGSWIERICGLVGAATLT